MSSASRSAAAVAVLGAGAWGTVLAVLLAGGARAADAAGVRLWARDPAAAERLRATRENPVYLPGLRLPATVRPTADLEHAVGGAELALVAVPVRALDGLVRALPQACPPLVLCCKGITPDAFQRPSEVVQAARPDLGVAVLSGPNLAAEIAAGKPAAATVASRSDALARGAQARFDPGRFRVYTSRDVVGVEIAGALKNVIALAAGMSDGLGLGDNAKATIITRGLAEIARLGTRLGGRARTFYGLAGVGDLVATCSSAQSRNHLAGERLARGATLADIEASRLTAEGLPTVRAVHALAQRLGLELPISAEVYRVAYEGKDPRTALADLMTRGARPE